MAMVRSSIKGMWNLSCKGSTYLYTGAKMGTSLMFGTWRRGLMSLLVLASLPFLAPVLLVSMMVGGIFLVPILCGVTAYCALFRPASLSNFIKWFRPPKSVVRSGPRSAELVMEDLDIGSEHFIITNETDQSEPQEFDLSSALLNASVVEIEAFELRSPSRSTAENIFEEPDAFLAVPVTEEDKVAALIAVKSMQDDEVRSSREGSTMDIKVEPHPEQILGSDTIAREVGAADSDERATMLMEDKQQEEDDEVVNDRGLIESDLPAFEHVKTVTVGDHQDLSALKQVEEPNRLDERLAEAQSSYEEPAAFEEPKYFVESKAVLIAREQQQLEEPEFRNEGTTDAQSASEDLKAVGEPENLDSEVVEEKEDEGHAVNQLTPGKGEKRFDDYNEEIKKSENEQEQVDAIESKGRKLTEDTAHGLEEKTLLVEEVADVAPVEVAAPVEEATVKKTSESASQVIEQEEVEARAPEVMKEVGAPVAEDISIVEPETTKGADVDPAVPQVLIEDGAAIVQEKGVDIPLVVSEPTSKKKEVSAVEEEDVPAPSLKSEVLIMKQHPRPVDSEAVNLASPAADVPAIADAAPAEVVASAEDSDANDLYKGSAPVVEEREVKCSAPMEHVIPERAEDLEAPVLAEKGAETFVQEAAAPEAATSEASVPIAVPIAELKVTKEVEGKLDDVSVGLEKEMGDSVLESTCSVEEQHSMPVDSEPVELASRVVDAPAITVAAPVQEASVKGATLVEGSDAKEAEVAEAPMIIEKVVEPSVEEAGTSKAYALIVEPDVAREAAVESAAPEVGAEEEVRFVQEEAEVASEPVPVEARAEKVEFPVVEDKDMKAPVAALEKVKVEESPVVVAPAQEGAAPVAEAPLAQPELTKEVKEPAEPAPALESAPVVVEKSLLEKAAPVENAAPLGEGVVEEGEQSEASEMDVKEMKAPMVALQEIPTAEDAAAEAEAPIADVEGTKESGARPAVPEAFVEKAQTLEDKVELPLVVSEPTVEAAGVREPSISTGSVAGAPVIAEKSLSAKDSIQVQQPEPPVVEKEVDAHVAETSIEEVKHGEAPEAEVPVNEPDVTKDSSPAFTAGEESPDVREVERLEANGKPRQEGQHRIASNLEPSSNVQDSMAVDEDLNQASQDRSVKVSDMDLEDARFVSAPSSQAQREEQGNEAEVDAQRLEEKFDKDKVVESHTEQDVFPTLKPLNIVQSKDSAYDEEAKKSDTILISGPAQRRISFEGVGADDEQQTTFSGAGSGSGEPHTGEFEGLLQSWQGRDRAPHSRISVSPSVSPRSPAEIGRQIREEISTIQKIIGEEIPPQDSLWKKVETLSQIVGMELPYMGDVSDLTKARHGLDLLKVVVGIK